MPTTTQSHPAFPLPNPASPLPDPTSPEKPLQTDADDKRKGLGSWASGKETKFVNIDTNVFKCIDSELGKESDSLLTILGTKGEKYNFVVLKVTNEAEWKTGKSYLVSLDSAEGKIEYKDPSIAFTSGYWLVIFLLEP